MIMNKTNRHVFLYDRILDPDVLEQLRLGMVFVAYGRISAQMFNFYDQQEFHKVAVKIDATTRPGTMRFVYGAIFALKYPEPSLVALDGYYGCSKARLGVNIPYDTYRRDEMGVQVIYPQTLRDIKSKTYLYGEVMPADVYLGNHNNEKVKYRINRRANRYPNGIDIDNFAKLFNKMRGEC